MKDRIPLYPGRVTLTPVSGQSNTYDMERADSPTETGTPLNTANLFSDTTAARYPSGTTTVDDALNFLAYSGFTTGDIKWSVKNSLGSGWLKMDGGHFNALQYPELADLFPLDMTAENNYAADVYNGGSPSTVPWTPVGDLCYVNGKYYFGAYSAPATNNYTQNYLGIFSYTPSKGPQNGLILEAMSDGQSYRPARFTYLNGQFLFFSYASSTTLPGVYNNGYYPVSQDFEILPITTTKLKTIATSYNGKYYTVVPSSNGDYVAVYNSLNGTEEKTYLTNTQHNSSYTWSAEIHCQDGLIYGAVAARSTKIVFALSPETDSFVTLSCNDNYGDYVFDPVKENTLIVDANSSKSYKLNRDTMKFESISSSSTPKFLASNGAVFFSGDFAWLGNKSISIYDANTGTLINTIKTGISTHDGLGMSDTMFNSPSPVTVGNTDDKRLVFVSPYNYIPEVQMNGAYGFIKT